MLFLETGRKVTEMSMSEGRFVESRKGWQEEPENCASWPQCYLSGREMEMDLTE